MNRNIFVISDTWFNRPIGDKSNMTASDYNDEVVNNWNSIVNKSDDIYVLGGFGISDLYNIVIRLNGKIHFLNNYYTDDEILFYETLKKNINDSIDKKLLNRIFFEDKQILTLNKEDIVLSYFPLSYWYGKDTGTICFHGLSDKTNFKNNNINCCYQLNKFKPLNVLSIKENIEKFKKYVDV